MRIEFPWNVEVRWSEYGTAVPYAAALAESLGIPLEVSISASQSEMEIAGQFLDSSPEKLRREMKLAVSNPTRKFFNDPRDALVSVTIAPTVTRHHDDTFVSCERASDHGQNVLYPAGERRIFRGKKGPIFIPLGDGDSGMLAASHGAILAKRLSTHIIFWHTTWRNEKIASTDPRKHVCENAERVINGAERSAREYGVPFAPTQVECADTVVESIVRAALYSGASLIVMARGKRKKFGAYPDRVRARNCPVPLLILSQGETR